MHKSAYSPAQFCDLHGIARTTFYALLKDGRGPRLMKVGRRTLISIEAATEWRQKMEAAYEQPKSKTAALVA
jgi:predicted DNA-binding transcriptional regulator AlpA